MDYEKLEPVIEKLRNKQFDEDKCYYHTTIVANERGMIENNCFSTFEGFTVSSPPRELRKARPVDPIWIKKHLDSEGRTPLVIDSDEDVWVYDLFGGDAIIEKTICERYYPQFTTPFEVIQIDPYDGYISIQSAPKYVFDRATNPKNRMKILERDKYRCRICGRSPKDNVDIVLNIHHILPWSMGGLTIERNLITLCHTCHRGLDPHYKEELHSFNAMTPIEFGEGDFTAKLKNYHKLVKKTLKEE